MIDANIDQTNNVTTIIPKRSLESKDRKKLENLCEEAEFSQIVIDFKSLDILDSTGVGMLFGLQNKIKDKASVSLVNCNNQVLEALYIACLHRLFSIPQMDLKDLSAAKKAKNFSS